MQAPAHHTSMRTLATEGDTARGNDLTAQPSASPPEWQRSKGPQVMSYHLLESVERGVSIPKA